MKTADTKPIALVYRTVADAMHGVTAGNRNIPEDTTRGRVMLMILTPQSLARVYYLKADKRKTLLVIHGHSSSPDRGSLNVDLPKEWVVYAPLFSTKLMASPVYGLQVQPLIVINESLNGS